MASASTKVPASSKRRSSSPLSEVHRARIQSLRKKFKDVQCDALVITNEKDIRYFIPFSGESSTLIILPKSITLISDTRFEEELDPLRRALTIVMRSGAMIDALSGVLNDLGQQTYALQADSMSASMRAGLASGVGAKRLKDTTGIVAALRRIKDATEVRLIRKAAAIQQQAMEALIPQLEPGLTEYEVAAMLEFEMRRRGADGPSFETIAAARANGSKPHARPGKTKLAPNQPLLIDWGARYEGYCSDMTRVFCFGKWPRALRDAYQITLEAFNAGVAAVKPGARCVDVDAAARAIIEKSRFPDRFVHSLGHGIGLDVHELPRLSKQSDETLMPGDVVTVEPGIYLPGVGGIRLEDDILVTPSGRRNLCGLPKDLEWATL